MMRSRRCDFILVAFMACIIFMFCICYKKPDTVDVHSNIYTEMPRSINHDPIPGVPYQYPDEVDLRFIVMVYNRAKSLGKCLNHLNETKLDKKVKARIEIWIDRNVEGDVDSKTLEVAQEFEWQHGPVGIHVWPRHVGIYGQWIDTWRPQHGSKEIAVLLEDDVDVSPYLYPWLLAARDVYNKRKDIGSISLNNENVCVSTGKSIGHLIQRPMNETTFLYPIVATWGMAPIGTSWRSFQDWYHNVTGNTSKPYHPYTPGATLQTQWYKMFEKRNQQDTMWSIWYIHYCFLHELNSLFVNIGFLKGKSLTRHRRAKGLHYGNVKEIDTDKYLLKEWKEAFVHFPLKPMRYDYNGTVIK